MGPIRATTALQTAVGLAWASLLIPAGALGMDAGERPPSDEKARTAAVSELLRILDEDGRPAPARGEDGVPRHLKDCWEGSLHLGEMGYERTTVLATLPDPLDSPFGREADAFLLAIEQAMSRLDFVNDEECLAWRPAARAERPQLHREHPGALLFRRAPGGDDGGEAVLLLTVGETPGGGVQAGALESAFDLLARDPGSGGEVKILGPTFSGSANSLAVALRRWIENLGQDPRVETITLRSGSATNTGLEELFDETFEELGVEGGFRSVPASNTDLQSCVWNRLVPERLGLDTRWDPGPGRGGDGAGARNALDDTHPCRPTGRGTDNGRVALLVEHSAYGRQFRGSGFHIIPVSPHLGALRAAYDESRGRPPAGAESGADGWAAKRSTSRPRALRLELGLGSGANLSFDPESTLLSQDLVLTDLLRSLAGQRVAVVGIIATNTLDKIFLAESLAAFAPETRVLTMEGDVLLAHPSYREATRGMIVASSHPLREPDPFHDRGGGVRRRFDFDGAQGAYLAMQELLAEEPPPPVGAVERRRSKSVWFAVVANGGFRALERIRLRGAEEGAESAAPGGVSGRGSGVIERLTSVAAELWGGAGPSGEVATARAGVDARTPTRLPRGWWLVLTVVTLALAAAVLQVGRQWSRGEALFGLVPLELIRLRSWRRRKPTASHRSLHALVALIPVVVGMPYLIVALPALGRSAGSGPGAEEAGLGASAFLDLSVASLSLLCVTGLALAGAYLLVGLSLRTVHDLGAVAHRRKPGRIRATIDTVLPLLTAVSAAALSIGITVYWILRTWAGGENGILLLERSLALDSGVSPVLPSLLIAAVPVAWCLLSLHRLQASEALHEPSPIVDASGPREARRLRRIEQLRQAIDPGALWQGARGSWVLLVVIPILYLALYYGFPPEWPLRGMEGTVFDMTTSLLFGAAVVMIVASGISLHRGWTALRGLLDWIKGLESRLPTREDDAVSLPAAYAVAADSRRKAAEDRAAAWQELTEEVERAGGGSGDPTAPRLAQTLRAPTVENRQASALVAVAGWLEDADGPAPAAGRADGEPEVRNSGAVDPRAESALGRAACTYFVRSAACLLQGTLVQLAHLMTFMTAGLIVLLVAVNVYPFEPRRALVVYLGILITVGALLSATVVIQAERDRLLGRLTGASDRARLRGMVSRLALYAGLPMASLLASRFPGVRQALTEWVEPLFKALL